MAENFGILQGLSIYDNSYNKVDLIIVDSVPSGGVGSIGSLALDSVSGNVYRKSSSGWKNLSSLENISVFDFKSSVLAATTSSDGNINLSSFSGSIDGVSVVSGGRYLIKNQTDKKENGIYVYDGTGFERSEDCDEDEEVTSGLVVPVSGGSVNVGSLFILISADPIVVGTSELEFMQIGLYTAGNGISINGKVVSVLLNSNGGLKFDNGVAVDNDVNSVVISGNKVGVRGLYKNTGVISSGVNELLDSVSVSGSGTVEWVVTVKKSNAMLVSRIFVCSVNNGIDYSVSGILKVGINNFTIKPSFSVSLNGGSLELRVNCDSGLNYYLTRDVNG